MIIYDMPASPAPSELELYIERNQVKVQSFSQLTQIQKNPGDRWIGKVTLPLMTANQAADWLGFFDALDGYVNAFRLPHPDYKTIRGTAPNNTGRVAGGGQRGISLQTSSWPNNRSTLFRRGDMIEVGGKLKRITADAASTSSGAATLRVAPPFYNPPVDQVLIKTQNVTGVFRLSEGFVAPRSDMMRRHTFNFAIEEVLP